MGSGPPGQHAIIPQNAIEDGPLYEHLFAPGDEAAKEAKYSTETYSPKVAQWINRFLAPAEEKPQVGRAN